MRLCAALALVLVALLVVTFEVVRRHPHHLAPPAPEAEVVELAPPAPVPVPARRTYVPRPIPRMTVAPVVPAKIAGHLRLPDDIDTTHVEIVARASGSPRWDSKGKAGKDSFLIEDLVAGRRYDVEFRGDRVRTLTMIGIVAPAEEIDVGLELRATIHLAVGFPRGGKCPVDSVFAQVGGPNTGDGFGILSFSDDCRFDFDAPVSAGLVTVVADGDGIRYEAAVIVPDHGDPEPICLNPPCRANPLEGTARLRFSLDGAAPDTGIVADVRPAAQGANTRYACRSSVPTCEIDGLAPGDVTFTASGVGCGAEGMTITLVAGDNDVTVPCMGRTNPEEDPGEASSPDVDEGA